MTSTEITLVLGTRPEIIKLSPIIRECNKQDIPYSVIHTGQHYSKELDEVFFNQLDIPTPDYNLHVGSGSHGEQSGEMLKRIEEVILEENPQSVLVQGDTNTVVAGAIAGCKLDVTLGHVEAGLRSFNREMPEEMNRIVADHVSDVLFPPTQKSRKQLEKEGIPEERIVVSGNTIVDAVKQNKMIAKRKSEILSQMGLDEDFILMTAHRAENVDDPNRFNNMLEGAARVGDVFDVEIIYPIHPRAKKKIDEFNLNVPDRVQTIEPCDYLDFLMLEMSALVILTDSGGVQEEACILETPCVTLREDTERPETVDVGANLLVGTNQNSIVEGTKQILAESVSWENPFGDGTASKRILHSLGYIQPEITQ